MKTRPDKIFDDRLLASVYDDFDADRSDLDPYIAMAQEFNAQDVADLGSGTGVLALLLAQRGLSVTAIDPALGSIEVAKAKPGAEQVNWLHGYSDLLPKDALDFIYMTGNTSQAILSDEEWDQTLRNVKGALKYGGYFCFETRKPSFEAWKEWNKKESHTILNIPGKGEVESWVDLIEVKLPYVSFKWTWVFRDRDTILISDSTIRFRSLEEVTNNLIDVGFTVTDVREAPDRPGKEMVFIARKYISE